MTLLFFFQLHSSKVQACRLDDSDQADFLMTRAPSPCRGHHALARIIAAVVQKLTSMLCPRVPFFERHTIQAIFVCLTSNSKNAYACCLK